MKFRILYQTSDNTQSPVRIVEEKTKREVGWTNRYLEREYVRRLGDSFHQAFLRRRPMGLGRPRVAMSRLRVRTPKRHIVPLSIDEVARFWSSFRSTRDLAIVGLMLLQGLRSAEVLP